MRKSSRKNLKASLFYIIFILLVVINLSLIVYAQYEYLEPNPNQVIVYEDDNFQGSYQIYTAPRDVDNISGWETEAGNDWNDRISSLKVGQNAQVTLYSDSNYEGDHKTFTGFCTAGNNISSLSSIGWNDKVTSFHVGTADCAYARDPGPDEVILYEDDDFQGSYIVLTSYNDVENISNYQLHDTASEVNWNDKISSLKVGQNIKVILFKDNDFHGSYTTFQGTGSACNNISSLSSIGWNDTVTSLKIRFYERDPNPDEVIFYEHDDYQGSYIILPYTSPSNNFVNNLSNWKTDSEQSWNDKISSLKMGLNMGVTLYEHQDRVDTGRTYFLQSDCSESSESLEDRYIPSLSDLDTSWNWNDMVTSFEIRWADCYNGP